MAAQPIAVVVGVGTVIATIDEHVVEAVMMAVEVMVVQITVPIAMVVVHGNGAFVTERRPGAREVVEAAASVHVRPAGIGEAPPVSNATAPALHTAPAAAACGESMMAASTAAASSLDEFDGGGRDRWSGRQSAGWGRPCVRGMKSRPLARAVTATMLFVITNLLFVRCVFPNASGP